MLLDVAKFQIASDGYMSEENRKKILLAFFLWDAPFALVCRYAGPEGTKMEGQPSGQVLGEQTEQEHQKIIALIDEKLEMISTWQKFVLKREELAVDAEARSFSLPPADAIDKPSATKLTWTDNFIVLWTNWNECKGSAKATMCLRR